MPQERNIHKSCKIAAQLSDKSDTEPLTFGEKMRLRFHNTYCKGCRRYHKVSGKISGLFQMAKNNPPVLSNQEKNQLKDRLTN